jgi:hypothetical protein
MCTMLSALLECREIRQSGEEGRTVQDLSVLDPDDGAMMVIMCGSWSTGLSAVAQQPKLQLLTQGQRSERGETVFFKAPMSNDSWLLLSLLPAINGICRDCNGLE